MKTKTKILEEVIYIAEDGQEFKTKAACERYEIQLELKNKKWLKNRINTDNSKYPIMNFEDSFYLEFFWLDNKEDFNELCIYLNELVDLYKYKSPGWYVVVEDRNDSNWIDVVRIEYLSDYLQEYKDDLDKWINGILELVQSKEVKET